MKKKHDLNVENYDFFVCGLSEDISPENSLSALRDCSKHKRGAKVYKFLQQNQVARTSEYYY